MKENFTCITCQTTMIKEPNTKTNTHPALVCLFHFNNVGSFQGLANDTPIVFKYFFMVWDVINVNGFICGNIEENLWPLDLVYRPFPWMILPQLLEFRRHHCSKILAFLVEFKGLLSLVAPLCLFPYNKQVLMICNEMQWLIFSIVTNINVIMSHP